MSDGNREEIEFSNDYINRKSGSNEHNREIERNRSRWFGHMSRKEIMTRSKRLGKIRVEKNRKTRVRKKVNEGYGDVIRACGVDKYMIRYND